ncbi:MAG: hypothetical protein K2X87_22240, partial [Gemmataceae bacterium]|nr:hypothetical protein [Gemmataceae bacterium]
MGPVTNSRRAAGRAWPENCDYRDALQHPGLCLSPGLVPPGGDMRRNRAGQPVIWPGGFGAVFQYVRPDGGAVALKVFTKPNPERGERFRAVAAHLATLGPDRPPGLVGFGYAPGGIRVNGGWFPVQTMDWVKGETLGEWFAEAMGRGRADAVRDVAGRFARLVADFRRARIAHGDLQHDNVMVVGGDLRLVDYDGMVVPAIEGRPQFEIGKEAYQHPRRAELPLGPAVDSFAAWLILIALRAAAADPGLFDRYYVRPKNENLLFTPDDLRAPRESRLWAELVGFKADPEVRTWAAALRVALDGPPERVPPFDLDPWGHFRDLVRVRDWTGAADVGGRLARAGATTPADLRGKPDEARDRVAALAQAE